MSELVEQLRRDSEYLRSVKVDHGAPLAHANAVAGMSNRIDRALDLIASAFVTAPAAMHAAEAEVFNSTYREWIANKIDHTSSLLFATDAVKAFQKVRSK